MTPHGRTEWLAGLPVFEGLDGARLEEVATALESVSLRGGETLLRLGDRADALYILVHGRLQEYRGERTLRDFEAGELVGELELLVGEVRTTAVRSLRDSQLLRLDAKLFHRLIAQHPPALIRITRAAVAKLRPDTERRASRRSITVIPAGSAPVSDDFIDRLARGLGAIGPTLVVSRDSVESALGPRAAQAMAGMPGDSELIGWLHAAEQRHKFLVYRADDVPSAWTQRCMRQCDDVLLAARAGSVPAPNAVEVFAAGPEPWLRRADRVLALVHEEGTRPAATSRWLEGRPVRAYEHVRAGSQADHDRLARLLTGRAVGLALGGGAARGFAHVGVLRALERLRLPIDTVTGASFGAVVAAGVAMGWDHQTIEAKLRQATSKDRSLLDVTLPIASLTTGRRLTQRLRHAFGDADIEDLSCRFACVSTDVSAGREFVHREGPVWRALRASTSLPGIFPPARSDTSQVLLDGSIVMDVPMDLARHLGRGGRVIGVDLKAPVRFPIEDLPADGIVSGWPLGLAQLLPFRRRPRVPSLVHVLAAATMIGSAGRERSVDDNDLRLSPPVDHIGLLRFDRCEEAIEVGYRHAMERLPGWLDGGAAATTRIWSSIPPTTSG